MLVHLVSPKVVVVFGVALDVCVYYVLRGLAKHAEIKLSMLKDAVKGLDTSPDQEIYNELEQMGVEVTDFGNIKRHLQCG